MPSWVTRVVSLCLSVAVMTAMVAVPTLAQESETDRRLPLLDGGFWQPNSAVFLGMSNDELVQEIRDMKALGMEMIIFQYSGRWDADAQAYRGYLPSSVLEMFDGYAEHNPMHVIIEAAEREGVKVVLGGLLMPRPRGERWQQAIEAWLSDDAMTYRREILERYAGYDCVVGYYTPNEYNPDEIARLNGDPQELIDATQRVLALVDEIAPDLEIIHSIGLYLERDGDGHRVVREEVLDRTWRPWVEQLDHVDTWMIIDGVGTTLSYLKHTDMAQAWCARIAHEYGKAYWTDVENAWMTSKRNEPFTMDRLEDSLDVAAKHADYIVTFDYLHYMSRNSDRPAANKLYEDYAQYRERVLSKAGAAGDRASR